jgi:RNA polymerase sigma-70 factor (ECF subfamily)
VKNWLLLRARSRAIDRLRKHSRVETRYEIEEKDLSESVITMNQNISDPLEQLDYHHAQRAIKNLSPEHELLIRASYFEDLTYREIAKKYNIPEGTVKSRMLAAFKILRKQLFLTYRGEE